MGDLLQAGGDCSARLASAPTLLTLARGAMRTEDEAGFLRAEKIRILLRHFPLVVAGNTICALVVAAVLARAEPGLGPALWAGALAVVSAVRLLWWSRRWRRTP